MVNRNVHKIKWKYTSTRGKIAWEINFGVLTYALNFGRKALWEMKLVTDKFLFLFVNLKKKKVHSQDLYETYQKYQNSEPVTNSSQEEAQICLLYN